MGFLRKLFSRNPKDQTKEVKTLTQSEQYARFMNNGRANRQANQLEQALEDFGRAIELIPHLGIAYFDRGTTHHMNNNHQAALNDLEIAIVLLEKRQMERTVAYHNRGLILESLGKLGEAIHSFEIANQAGFESSTVEIGRILERYDQNEITSFEPPKLDTLCKEARSIYNTNPLGSLVKFSKAKEYYPHSFDACYGMALTNVSLSRHLNAINDFTETIELKPPSGLLAEALYNRGSLLKGQGNIAQAVDDLEKSFALAQDPTVPFPVLGDKEKESLMMQHMENNLRQTKEMLTS